ncbi:MAG: DUF5302 domain-containing protein [Streptosporangiaceae bacterium]
MPDQEQEVPMAEANADPEGPETPEVDANETAEEAAKRKFREALERKKGPQAGSGGAGKNSSKVRGAHAQAGGQKMFRRKAGG